MAGIASVNGVLSTPEEARVPIDDRGFLFGDGVYEVIRVYAGRLWAFEQHLKRLERSLREIAIDTGAAARAEEWIREAMPRSGLQEALLYVQVTRGAAPRRHTFDPSLTPGVVITVRPFDPVSADLRSCGAPAIIMPDIRWARRDIKSLNLLPNVLARQAAQDAGAYEAIFVEPDGRVTEGSSANVFVVVGNDLWTAPADHHILAGITRDLVLALCRENGFKVREKAFTLDWLRVADEVFVTGTTTEVLGVTRLNGKPVGNGQVGPVTQRLFALFEDRVKNQRDGVGRGDA